MADLDTPLPFYVERLQRNRYVDWLIGFADWTHAVTVTFQRLRSGSPPSKSATIKATAHFISVLNRKLLGRNRGKRDAKIPCAAVWGSGLYGDNPHVHLALQSPANLSYGDMVLAIESAIHRTRGIGFENDIQPYTSDGWLSYMVDHGTDYLLIELISPAKH